jgi:WD40 repeat protein
MVSIHSSGLVIAAGTYDGVLAGWEFRDPNDKSTNTTKTKDVPLTLGFATTVHEGSIRSLCIAGNANKDEPGSLLSCGYDETMKTHDWNKRQTSSGEVRTPSGFGTPMCSAFAPPTDQSTHCIVGFNNEGKICIYKKRDWSIQHVLAGHDGGVGALAVHPTGKLALSGGVSDGKLKLWDLTKGRLSFVQKIDPSATRNGSAHYDPISSVIWSPNGDFYALSHGSHITVREVASGRALLDVELPSKVNQVVLMVGPEGLFVAAACNDGSLPVLAVEDDGGDSRRAIMAIEPVDSHLAREERFKCIQSVRDYYVVTANSAGVVSLMNLQGAINMIMSDPEEEDTNSNSDDDDESGDVADDDNNDDSTELAVDIVESVRLGTGARITCLAAWCKTKETQIEEEQRQQIEEKQKQEVILKKMKEYEAERIAPKRTRPVYSKADDMMDEEDVKKARTLVAKAKKLKGKREKKVKKTKTK